MVFYTSFDLVNPPRNRVVLIAPIKLPAKAMNILKYISVGLGILETVLEDEKSSHKVTHQTWDKETAMLEQLTDENPKGQSLEIRPGKEEANEME
ncbi:hypothetical protein OHD16_17935 [Sphingobacterium sp. ML3W]|uniref:hypothetical protein n=1 Tax=Sphingobacterium sp. ML3W TaxID=1538644 RepID=UPI00249AFFDB|nr:hypothetical protein [Sphingobacterium sp. ML3W]WFA81838.1 hypothetical protein OGI71_11075 [Sphingobacterium sp. ML3W]